MTLEIFRDIAMAVEDAEIIEYEDNSPIDLETDKITLLPNAQHTDTGTLQLQFWTEFNKNSYQNADFSRNFKLRKAYPQHWYDIGVGSSSLHICLTVSRQKKIITAGLYIDNNKELYSVFKEHKQEIEIQLNNKIEWKEASKAARFFRTQDFDIDNKSNWNDAFLWFYQMCLILKKISS